MIRLAYIGDSLTARAFALAGAQTYTPSALADEVWRAVTGARAAADLVLLDSGHAELVAARLESLLLLEPVPPVVAVADFAGEQSCARDAAVRARRLLGVAG